MKVMITGGAGFVGVQLGDFLIQNGHEVWSYDLCSTSGKAKSRLGSILSMDDLLVASRDMDAIVHLAAVSNTQKALKDPFNCYTTNVEGTNSVLEAARLNGVSHVLIASSSLVSEALLGYKMKLPEDEELLMCDEQSPFLWSDHPYVSSKLGAELVARGYSGIQSVGIMRLGIMYGPGMTPGVLADIFIRAALAGEPLVIEGHGQQWRQYLHVDDTVRGIALMLEDGWTGTVNLTPSWITTVADMAAATNPCAEP